MFTKEEHCVPKELWNKITLKEDRPVLMQMIPSFYNKMYYGIKGCIDNFYRQNHLKRSGDKIHVNFDRETIPVRGVITFIGCHYIRW